MLNLVTSAEKVKVFVLFQTRVKNMDEEFFDKLMVVFCIIQSTTLCITGEIIQSRPIECVYVLALMYVDDIGNMCVNLDCFLSLLDLYLYQCLCDKNYTFFYYFYDLFYQTSS